MLACLLASEHAREGGREREERHREVIKEEDGRFSRVLSPHEPSRGERGEGHKGMGGWVSGCRAVLHARAREREIETRRAPVCMHARVHRIASSGRVLFLFVLVCEFLCVVCERRIRDEVRGE